MNKGYKIIQISILIFFFSFSHFVKAQSFSSVKDPAFIKQCNVLLIQTHPHQFKRIKVDTVLQKTENRYAILYSVGNTEKNEVHCQC